MSKRIVFINFLDTILSYFRNDNTASRVYQFQDKSGTIAHLDDVPGSANQSEVNAGAETAKYVSPATLQDRNDDSVALVDGATIDITGPKHTLSTATGRTFTISHAGDDIVLVITLSATSATMTFPAAALCVSEGTASGDNTLSLSGVSGDKYLIGILKVGSAYYVGSKNTGQ